MMTLMIAMNDKNLSHPPINANTRESVFAFIRVHSRFQCLAFSVFLRASAPPRATVFLRASTILRESLLAFIRVHSCSFAVILLCLSSRIHSLYLRTSFP